MKNWGMPLSAKGNENIHSIDNSKLDFEKFKGQHTNSKLNCIVNFIPRKFGPSVESSFITGTNQEYDRMSIY